MKSLPTSRSRDNVGIKSGWEEVAGKVREFHHTEEWSLFLFVVY